MKCRYCANSVESVRVAKSLKSCAKCAKAARRKAVREPPLVLTEAPVLTEPVKVERPNGSNWLEPRWTICQRADLIIRSGCGYQGCVEEDGE